MKRLEGRVFWHFLETARRSVELGMVSGRRNGKGDRLGRTLKPMRRMLGFLLGLRYGAVKGGYG